MSKTHQNGQERGIFDAEGYCQPHQGALFVLDFAQICDLMTRQLTRLFVAGERSAEAEILLPNVREAMQRCQRLQGLSVFSMFSHLLAVLPDQLVLCPAVPLHVRSASAPDGSALGKPRQVHGFVFERI